MLSVEHLFELGERLDQAEFKLAPHQFLSARYVLETLEARRMLPPHRHELAPLLAPIFCSSAVEQKRFPPIYFAWLNDRFAESVPRYEPDTLAERKPPVVPTRLRLAWKPLLAIVGVALLAVTAWAAYQNLRTRVIAGEVTGAGSQEATVQIDDGLPTSVDDGRFGVAIRAIDMPVTLRVTAPRYLPHEEERVGEDLAAQRRWLFLWGENPDRIELPPIELTLEPEQQTSVAIELPPARSAAPAPLSMLTTIDVRSSLPAPPLSQRVIWKDAAWTLAPFGLFLFWQVWRATRRPILQRLASSAPPLLRDMHLPKGVGSIAPGLPMRRLVQELRRRRLMNSVELQVDQTISATLRNAGLFTPVLGSRVEPDHLALIDSMCLSDHQARFCTELVSELARSDVLIEQYTFDRIPAVCERRDAKSVATGRHSIESIPVDELLARNPDHRVLLFTDGSGLFDPFTGTPAPCVATLLQWEAPFLLTPKPLTQWGELEWALENLGFKVLPLTREGLLLLMGMLSGAPSLHLAREKADAGRSVPRYDRGRRRWLERSPPDAAEVKRLCDALQSDLSDAEEGCSDRGFAWLAGCAVYPEIHWGITLRIGAALVPDDAMRELLLPRLARLVWLRDAYMPDWMRQELLNRLGHEDEERIRGVVHDMLGMLSGEPDADVPLQIAVPATDASSRWKTLVTRVRALLEAWRRRRRSEAVIRAAKPDSPLRDYVFLRFISGQSVGKLSLTAPGALLQLLFRGGSPFLGFRPLLVLLTTLIASLAIGVALGPLHTGQLLTPLLGVQFSADGTTVATPFMTMREDKKQLDGSEFIGSGMVLSKLGSISDYRIDASSVVRRSGGFMNTVSISPDQKRIAYIDEKTEGSDQEELVLWDLTTGTEVGRRPSRTCPSSAVNCVRFTPDGTGLAYAGRSTGVDLWWTDARPEQRFNDVDQVSSLAFSPDGRLLAMAGGAPGFQVVVRQVQDGTQKVTGFSAGEAIVRLEFSPDARRLFALFEERVVVFDAATGARLVETKIEKADYLTSAVDPAGRLMAYVHSGEDFSTGGATLIDLETGAHLEELKATETSGYVDAAFSPDGRLLATGAFDGTLSLWQIPENYPAPADGRSLALVIANEYPVRAINPPTPIPGARSIATTLRERYGFGVTLLENATRARMLDALGQLTNILRPADQLLVYFAGEVRASESGPFELRGTDGSDDWLTGTELTEALYDIRAGQVLVVTAVEGASSAPASRAPATRAPVGSRELIASLSRDNGVEFARAFNSALRVANSAHSSEWLYAETRQRVQSKEPVSVTYARIASVGDKPGNFMFRVPSGAPDRAQSAATAAAANSRLPNIPNRLPGNDKSPSTNALPESPPVQQQAAVARLDVSGGGRRDGERYVLDFGDVRVGSYGSPLPFQITNTSGPAVRLTSQPASNSAFNAKDGCTGRTISVKESCEGMVEFYPRSAGQFEENFSYYEDKELRVQIVLRGTGVADAASKPAPPAGLQAQ